MEIQYRIIKNYPDYRINNIGDIQSLNPDGTWSSLNTWLVKGYPTIRLYNEEGYKTYYVHRLVLETFVGPCPIGFTARHYPDSTKTNIRLDNLSWASYAQNQIDNIERGCAIGENHYNTCLTEQDVKEIRKLYQETQMTQKEIGELFDINYVTVSDIVRRMSWKHVL